jgi:hypothetical protein
MSHAFVGWMDGWMADHVYGVYVRIGWWFCTSLIMK